jgi:hypothetical protein|eukprot:COSAG02_NODE_2427_length_8886_cov_8.409469_5_plen_96_part_00
MQVTEAEEIYKLIQNKHSEWEAGKLPSMPTRPKSGQFNCCQIYGEMSNLRVMKLWTMQWSLLKYALRWFCCVLQLADRRALDERDQGVVLTKSTT